MMTGKTGLQLLIAMCTAVLVPLAGCTDPVASPQAGHDAAISHYVKGQTLKDAHKYPAALEEFRLALQEDPNLSVAYVASGDVLRTDGKYEGAIRNYENARRLNPSYVPAQFNLGLTYQAMADVTSNQQQADLYLGRACAAYQQALSAADSDPESAYDSNINLAACNFQMGQDAKAIGYCNAAAAIDDTRPDAYNNLGMIYDSQGKYDQAVAAYLGSLKRNSRQPKTHMNLGSTYMRQGKLKEAQESLTVAVLEDPMLAQAHEQMGTCCWHMGNYDRSMECFEKAIQANPGSADAYRGMGTVYMTRFVKGGQAQADLKTKAVQAWEKSLQLNPNQPKLRQLLDKYKTGTASAAK